MESVDQFRAHLYSMYATDKQVGGLYHCPFKATTSCEHEASRSRSDCEYVKLLLPFSLPINLCFRQYVDSHVKPYRCTFTGCRDLKFSSLACRLRHEKEAHGAHGHGVRPFHCLFPDCERSLPGHGFPRHWNRNDHMKRVHGHSNARRRRIEESSALDASTLERVLHAHDDDEERELRIVSPKRRRKA